MCPTSINTGIGLMEQIILDTDSSDSMLPFLTETYFGQLRQFNFPGYPHYVGHTNDTLADTRSRRPVRRNLFGSSSSSPSFSLQSQSEGTFSLSRLFHHHRIQFTGVLHRTQRNANLFETTWTHTSHFYYSTSEFEPSRLPPLPEERQSVAIMPMPLAQAINSSSMLNLNDNLRRIKIIEISQGQVDEKKLCTICFDEFLLCGTAVELNCGHAYHEKCIFAWLDHQLTCPVCRNDLTKIGKRRRTSDGDVEVGDDDTRLF